MNRYRTVCNRVDPTVNVQAGLVSRESVKQDQDCCQAGCGRRIGLPHAGQMAQPLEYNAEYRQRTHGMRSAMR